MIVSKRDSNNQSEAMEKFKQVILTLELSKRSRKLRKHKRLDVVECRYQNRDKH